ncbi:hypothetical protein ACKXF4_15230 [Faecalibacterium prausnitzii]|uniref:hypothetical protein n=1 Tax=Faecalibacterium prausnitzii TaxID=853 RepID=UPI003AACE8DE
MAKRPTRLRFTEDDLADSHVKKAADRADKAVDRAEKAADKLASKKAKPKLKLETDAAGSRKAKLRFEKAEFTENRAPDLWQSTWQAVVPQSRSHPKHIGRCQNMRMIISAFRLCRKRPRLLNPLSIPSIMPFYSHKLKAYDKGGKAG